MFAIEKPLPLANEDTQEYWEGCKQAELRLQKCGECAHVRFPPSLLCPRCLSESFTWEKTSGRGKVYTWIVVHRPQHPAFFEDAPYNVVIVELDDCGNVLVPSNLVDCAPDEVAVGMPVVVEWDDITDEIAIPRFRRA